MKWKNKVIYLLILIGLTASSIGCKKYLEAKPDQKLVIPEKIEDLQALLDNDGIMNRTGLSYGEGASDNFYVTSTIWSALNEANRNNYIWEKEIVFNNNASGWAAYYQMIYFANTALEAIHKIQRSSSNKTMWDNIKGSALFYRSMGFLKVALTWAKAYDQNTASSDLGIPLRLNSDFNEISVRSSVKTTYEQILADVSESVMLLPVVPEHMMRPSRPAAYALMSRAYLAMQQYDKAGANADSCLQLYNTLLDYNTLTVTASFPVSRFNNETIFYSEKSVLALLAPTRANIDTVLYRSYEINDLRKQVYFINNPNGTNSWKGNYTNSNAFFDGIATDEVLLTRAECFARKGKLTEALNDLNNLLKKRFKTGTFIDKTASSVEAALQFILTERRKELLMRDLRWMDLKRLNKEPSRETTLKRLINNQTYILLPNENRYALPIPMSVINMTNMEQNPQ